LAVFAATGLALSITGLVIVTGRDPSRNPARALQPDPLAVGLTVPEFALTDQDGKPVSQQALDGRVTIIDFIFTNCPFVCPGMMAAMSDLSGALKSTPVRFMSFSVDPVHDTPERLREYARQHDADLSRWTFVTGDRGAVERIVMGSLQFALQADPSRTVGLPDGSTMDNIAHPKKLLLIGPDRRVLGFYDPDDANEMQRLRARARLAAGALAPAPPR
jgi:protein SCO1/2